MPVDLERILENKVLLFDGAMGTELLKEVGGRGGATSSPHFSLKKDKFSQKHLLKQFSEAFLLEAPEVVFKIHRAYVDAGADVIETNSFGANRLKLAEFGLEELTGKINTLSVQIAKAAVKGKKVLVAGSIGPTGQFLKPSGDLDFDTAFRIFSEQARFLAMAGADLICLETFSDLAEARAALIAVKENCSLPVIVHLTYSENGLTITGNSVESSAVIFKSLGADAIGINCGFGPDLALPLVEKLAQLRKDGFPFFISVLPNAGKPEFIDGKVTYCLTPENFAKGVKKLTALGANIVGGCCGTTPAHIKELKKFLRNVSPLKFEKVHHRTTWVASPSKVKKICFSEYPTLIGDRINPSGRPDLVKDIKSQKFQLVFEELKKQVQAGADILDINISHQEINEEKILPKLIIDIQKVIDLPLSIDTPNIIALEGALKNYPGRAIINSTTGSQDSLKKFLPLAKKYGAVLIGLTFDEKGVPQSVSGRLKIAQRIVRACENYGLSRDDLLIDSLAMTLGTSGSARVTLETLKAIKKNLKVKTLLGVGNISFGLPNRRLINSHFLSLAIYEGLDVALANPLSEEVVKAFRIACYLAGRDKNGAEFLKFFQKIEEKQKISKITNFSQKVDLWRQIYQAVLNGEKTKANKLTRDLLNKKIPPYKIIERGLLPPMKEVGELFSKGIYFLPQLRASAEAVASSIDICKEKMEKISAPKTKKTRILLATVEGDIHDLGKNLVGLIIGNQGYEVIDLGKNVSNQKILKAVLKFKPKVVCLSALLTTTMMKMKELKELFNEKGLKIPLLVGGAVVTEKFARSIGAYFAKDAVEAVKVIKKIKN